MWRPAPGARPSFPRRAAWAGWRCAGGGPASRELELLGAHTSVESITALMFSGGSAFGLDTASGAMRWCEEQGLGHDTGAARVPLIAAACIYDLGITGNARRPGAEEGYLACAAAREGEYSRGCAGAGTGATVAKLRGQDAWCKGGLGSASLVTRDGVSVAALAVVNAWGDVLDADGTALACAVDEAGRPVRASERVITHPPEHPRLAPPANTTLVCLATDARLSKAQAVQVARMAQAGMARAVSPVHTPFDGDVTVCFATGVRPASLFVVGVAAAEVTGAAIRDAVRRAVGLRGVPTGRERIAGAGAG
ncbi:MAG: P1 family peptidase [Miltoncostaeaceae bacterium]